MPKYTLFYRGGKPKNASEGRARQPKWNEWFSQLGGTIVDHGAAARSLGLAGAYPAEFENLPPTTGYSVIDAASEEEAMRIASTCPIYNEGGAVEVARFVTAESILQGQ